MGEYAEYEIDKVIYGFERRAERLRPSGHHDHSCSVCGKRFRTEQGVADHTRDVHKAK